MLPSFIVAFAQGIGLGGGLIVAIGAQNAYVLRQGLRREFPFAVATVCFACDLALIGLGAGGFGSLVAAFPALTKVAAWGGAAFLAWYGLRALRSALKPGALEADRGPAGTPSRGRAVVTALALSLLNPHVYLDTVVLIGGIAGQYALAERPWFAAGAMSASFLWFYGLVVGARWLAPLFKKPVAWRILDLLIAAVMWSIALSLLRAALA
jgi:L-lysine exporter family protein LysE/ArgO